MSTAFLLIAALAAGNGGLAPVASSNSLERVACERPACALKVLDCPVGISCRPWMKDGKIYLDVSNSTPSRIAGTVELNEIFEKALNVSNRLPAEIDGRWIEIDMPPGRSMTLRLGK